MSKASDAMKRNKALATKRGKNPKPELSPIEATLQQPRGEYPNRFQLLLSDDQDERVRRLAYEHKLSKVEVIRRMIDACSDEAIN